MASPKILKRMAIGLGMYAPARRLYRRFSGEARQQFKDDLSLYRNFVEPGDLVFDIGANMGVKSEVFAHLGANIVAVEPNPNCWSIIEKALGTHRRFVLVGEAIGSEVGSATLNFAGTSSTASIDPEWYGARYNDGRHETVTVPVTTLDALIETHGIPDFCKIDVEGFELQVVKGLSVPIKTISLEYHKKHTDQLSGCLEILQTIAPVKTNLIPMNDASLAFESWVSASDLFDYISSPEAPPVGDVFVQMDC